MRHHLGTATVASFVLLIPIYTSGTVSASPLPEPIQPTPVSCVHFFDSPIDSTEEALAQTGRYPDSELLFDLSLKGGRSLGGGIDVYDVNGPDGDPVQVINSIRNSLDVHLARKIKLANENKSGSVAADAQAIEGTLKGAATPWSYIGWRGDCGGASAAKTAQSAVPCPGILQGNPLFPFCPKDYLNVNQWAPDHGYWDAHRYASGAAWQDHVLFMFNRWSNSYRLSLFAGRTNSGFEINTYVKDSSDPDQRAIAASANINAWISDFPGAYIENLTFDDDVTTWAIGTDQADRLAVGREYQNTIFLRSAQRMGYPNGFLHIGLYGQVDLDMVAGGDAGFFVDQACCIRDLYFGGYESW